MLHYETIVPEARLLLEKLSDLPVLKDARLVGGTALALQLISMDRYADRS